MLSAVYNQRPCARALQSISNVGLSIPIFWFAPILLYVAAIQSWEIAAIGQYNLLYEIKPITGFLLLTCGLLMSLTEPKSYKTFYSI